MSEVEQWRATARYPGYEVSDQGRVRSVNRLVAFSDGRRRIYTGQLLKQILRDNGYLMVNLSRQSAYVHVLVVEAFVGPRRGIMVCRHLNGNPLDNRVVNLSWGTHADNIYDQVLHGTHPHASKERCIHNHRLVLPNLTPGSARSDHRICQSCTLARSRVHDHATRGRHLDFNTLADEIYAELMSEVVA